MIICRSELDVDLRTLFLRNKPNTLSIILLSYDNVHDDDERYKELVLNVRTTDHWALFQSSATLLQYVKLNFSLMLAMNRLQLFN